MISNESKNKLLILLQSLAKIWAHEDFKITTNDQGSGRSLKVKTLIEPNAQLLPITQHPIRGSDGVKMEVQYQEYAEKMGVSSFVSEVLFFSSTSVNENSTLHNDVKIFNACFNDFFDSLKSIENLQERIYESRGIKLYDSIQLTEKAQERDNGIAFLDSRYSKQYVLFAFLSNALKKNGFETDQQSHFSEWDNVANDIINSLWDLSLRQVHKYTVIALLNAPLVDSNEEISLGFINRQIANEQTELTIGFASDELLSKLVPPSPLYNIKWLWRHETINSVLKYRISIECNASVELYDLLYSEADVLMAKALDLVRLVCEDDTGIFAIHIIKDDKFTPDISEKNNRDYKSDLAVYNTRRMHFSSHSRTPISDENINTLRMLTDRQNDDSKELAGLNVALSRFRSSQDNYLPTDPLLLLDVAIALEAVFLNDTNYQSELKYRLSLRVAWLLGETQEQRVYLFKQIAKLYKLRSKIAHGERVENKGGGILIISATEILRHALIKFIEGHGPWNISKSNRHNWWNEFVLKGGNPKS